MRYFVEVALSDGWLDHGSVLLPTGASPCQIEGALMAVGVYAPRGADVVDWGVFKASCVIFDATGEPIVRLSAAPPKAGRAAR